MSQLDRGKALQILLSQSEQFLESIMLNVAATVAERGKGHMHTSDPRQLDDSTFGALAHAIVEYGQPDLTPHFVLDKEYLGAVTKTVIAQLMRESGFVEHFDSQKKSAGGFEKLIDGKKGDLIDSIFTSGFSFAGYLPLGLRKLVHVQ